MPRERHFWFTLEAKVMAVVVAVLVALPAVTLWIMDAQVTRQIRRDAARAADTAHDSFVKSLRVRTDELALRFRNIAQSNPAFLNVVRLGDAATMRDTLRQDVLGQYRDTDIVVFITKRDEVWGVRRETTTITPEAFASAADTFVTAAARGEEREGFVVVNHVAYRVVAMPVVPPEGFQGVLLFGITINDEALVQIKPQLSEIILLAGDQIIASTFSHQEALAPELNDLVHLIGKSDARDLTFQTIAGERYQPVVGVLEPAADIRYVLLSSSEQRLLALERTKLTIFGASVAGIILCAGLVWFFIRRITQPLSALRDNAEAVGRGDFSRRIDRFSNDECGDLAEAFNTMTTNLQSSRAELERAMQQVKTTQYQLIQSEKLSAVGQFVAGVAHELNNPLTSVIGFSELLQSMPADEKTHDFLGKIAKSAHRCHKIVQSLLGFARQHAPERRLIDIPVIVDEVLEIMAYDLRTSNIKVAREFAPGLPKIMGDAHQLQQVFINILANARQAIEPVQREGQIIIRVTAVDGRVLVQFVDNGPGIRPDHLARIFDPFFTTKPVGKGTGLGLSLCYGIVQEHGGKITAESELGKGATFTIDLPAVPTDDAAAPALISDRRGDSRPPMIVGSGRTVLVIDDESWILDLAAELLRGEGYTVETASGGDQAIQLLDRRKFDVIICDWKMPGLNGVRLYEHLRATSPEMAKRVLFMTGDVVSDNFQEFLRDREMTCLSKPFATRELRAAVAKVMA